MNEGHFIVVLIEYFSHFFLLDKFLSAVIREEKIVLVFHSNKHFKLVGSYCDLIKIVWKVGEIYRILQ
jgi:hypothetical protein